MFLNTDDFDADYQADARGRGPFRGGAAARDLDAAGGRGVPLQTRKERVTAEPEGTEFCIH